MAHDDQHAEASWVAAVAAGDRGAPLVALYDRYARRVYRLGLRSLGEAGAAEELVQETFLRLWRASGAYDPARGTVQAFVFTIAHRAALDHHRRASVRPRLAGSADAERQAEAVTAQPGPEEDVERRLFADEVSLALDALTPAHRQVLELGYRQELSQREIADRLGIPLGTVKTRTYHALRALKRALEERSVLA